MSPPATLVVVDRLDQILAPPREIHTDFPTLLQKIAERQYTGEVTLHFRMGVLKVIDVPGPKIMVPNGNGS